MIRRIFFVFLILLSLTLMTLANNYKEAVPIMETMVKALEDFITNMEKAQTAEAVIKTLDNYAKAVMEFAPGLQKLMKKYPELKDENTHPEELKPYTTKIEELTKKLIKLYGKLAEYKDDPGVKEAQKRWEKAMSSLDDVDEEEEVKEE